MVKNSIARIKKYATILDEIYQEEAVSDVRTSPSRLAREGRNAKEIMIPRIGLIGLGDYVKNVGSKSGSINLEYETKTFKYDQGIRLLAGIMDI